MKTDKVGVSQDREAWGEVVFACIYPKYPIRERDF